MIRKGLLLFFFVGASLACAAQNDDLMKQDSVKFHSNDTLIGGKPVKDTVEFTSDKPVKEIDSYAKRFNPRRASLLAAVLPGAGQIYTRKYWKAPLVWGGMGLLIYGVTFSEHQHAIFKQQLFSTINDPYYKSPQGYTQDQLRTIVDATRRQRDYFLILNFFVYILQIVDAHVDAHLKEFDLNPNLQVRMETIPLENTLMGRSTGIGLVFKF